jgi:hypothetical protein
MASQLTLFAEKEVLNYLFSGTAFPTAPPANWFIGLSTDAAGATAAKDGGTFTEVSGGSYARLSVTNNATNFPAATGVSGTATLATKTAAGPFTFATPTGSWGTVNGFFLADAVTAGNIWYYCDLTTPQTISSGNTVSFANGSISITLQ